MELDPVLISRLLTGLTLSFHIIFATIGVGIPLFISIAEFVGIKKNDPRYTLMAKRWTRGFIIIIAIGVVTGTAIGLQLSLVWPNFMQAAGNVIALPLFLEVFAFFFEAIFIGIYLYTWGRFKNPYLHWLLSLPIVIGAGMSAVFITTVNGFMNQPEGFVLDEGQFAAVSPMGAMLNAATPSKVFHVLSSAYLTGAALLAAIAAFMILKKKASDSQKNITADYHKKALKMLMPFVLVLGAVNILSGDISAKFLAEDQPEKLAAAEWHFETEENADLILFGWLDDNQEVQGEIRLPSFLSFLGFGDFDAEVTGLEEFSEAETPPLVIHYLFDLMVTIGFLLPAVGILYFSFYFLKKRNEHNRWILRLIVLGGPLAFLAIQLGWFFAELGRQPWIIRGFMTVEEAATSSPYIGLMFLMFLALYIVLGTLCIVVLRRLFRNNPAELELEKRELSDAS
ncbi:cytochrome ubiquinol oxidase subunit I [Salicibibacter halophilus]|uniref:Cytochrome ubiquinol oxidase subunit I n=1 Tax=Salicibibacter halophilus TaxID=2502791 RepID=A0A514LGF2_9BACI|nr:cytochrome ubiquinol oxidase subunit I [Salicibibacter halophilus]QDI90930.1 cytochrome ubiquinol oxidase subunit I [Salicibibacter halophilus]